jgi:hypothetical protein
MMLVKQCSGSCYFEKHHLAWMSSLEVDDGAYGGVVEDWKVRNATITVRHG